MKDYFKFRKYENVSGIVNLGVVYDKKEYCNPARGKYVVSYNYDDLLTYNELKEKLKEFNINIEDFNEESLLKELLENKELFYKFKIVESSDNELYMNGEESEYFFSLESIRNYVYKLNLKKRE